MATEGHPPNVRLAARTLRAVGAHVVETDANTLNMYGPTRNPDGPRPEARLPLADASFDLVVCRHGSYAADEVARVLRPGGVLVAQLVGQDHYPALNERLGGPVTVWLPPGAPRPMSLEDAGLDVLERREARPAAMFADVGAIVYYLRAVPWQIADFTVGGYRERLRRLHAEIAGRGGLRTHYHSHLVVARRPDVPRRARPTS